MADEETVERKDATERRVYNLPANLLARLRAYQVKQAIGSEAEAARRLLDYALQMRDTVLDILETLESRYAEEHDLRVLASEVLTKHMLVTQVEFEDDAVLFTLRNKERGKIESNGARYYQDGSSSYDSWNSVPRRPAKRAPAGAGAPPWEPAGGDLDDEIPF